ncbi:MAG: hypothetical protein DMG68_15130 [Acidobacteria bacterium]|jgi:antitoxin (DNA-binding transcriptional repressor) of toxin-antitoxin stability system|nr:MAG: hypothetical protein DMG68_15130 [Acidobacteriota bacterium]
MAPRKRISAARFHADWSAIIDEVQVTGTSLLITKRLQPVFKLVPARSPRETKPRDDVFGCLRGVITIIGDIVSKPAFTK